MTAPSPINIKADEDFVVAPAHSRRPQPVSGCAASLPTFAIDEVMAMAQALRPDMKPGVRMVAGKPWTYDADLLLSFKAREAVRAAPADLTRLSDADLRALESAAHRRAIDTKRGDGWELFGRVMDEKVARRASEAKAA